VQQMITHYRKSWAMRYLREAKAELMAARKMPQMAPDLIMEAVRKAQIAVYYSLGEPAFIEDAVHKAIQNGGKMKDPLLKCLIEIERLVQQISEAPDLNVEKAAEEVDDVIQMASNIVELFTEEKLE